MDQALVDGFFDIGVVVAAAAVVGERRLPRRHGVTSCFAAEALPPPRKRERSPGRCWLTGMPRRMLPPMADANAMMLRAAGVPGFSITTGRPSWTDRPTSLS